MHDTNLQDLAVLLAKRRVLIQTHDYPDPDAISSACGLQHLLRVLGVESTICCFGLIARIADVRLVNEYGIEIHDAAAVGATGDDAVILVDCQKNNANVTLLPCTVAACVDHHPARSDACYDYCDIRPAGACASIVADYYLSSGIDMPRHVATMLLYGLHVDTDSMMRGVGELDLRVFAPLHRIADHDMISRLGGNTLEFGDLRAFAAAIAGIRVFRGAAFVRIPFSCADALVAQVADFILSVAEIDIAVIWSERPEGLKFSVRSWLPDLHCGTMLSEVLAGLGSAGGHAHMAGGFVGSGALRGLGGDGPLADAAIRTRFLAWLREHHLPSTAPGSPGLPAAGS